MLLPQSQIRQKRKIGELTLNILLINKRKIEISMRTLELEKIENKDDDEIADAMRNSDGISKVRDFFYKKYKNTKKLKGASVTDYDSSFGIKQFFKAGLDPIEQYVGTFKVNVYYDEKSNTLEYTIQNTTSMTSAFYHASPSYDTGGPMSNYYQTYKFSEKLDSTKFKKK